MPANIHLSLYYLENGVTESYPCDMAIGDIGYLPGLGKYTFGFLN